MRIPVVDSRGIPLMPCHPAKARLLCKSGKARPRRNKLDLFYVQLCHTSVSGACQPTCTRLWYVVPAILHRRQLHRLEAEKGGKRKPYGSTRSLTLKRGTLIRHEKYGLCTVGGFDRKMQTISLNEYRTNKRQTQGAKIEQCRVLTWVAFRSWLVGKTAKTRAKKAEKGKKPPTPSPRGRPVSSHRRKADN